MLKMTYWFLGMYCLAMYTSCRTQEKRPNIIVILADDLGYGDMSIYGGDVPVPSLATMAKEGMRFTDFHSNGAVCSPTRAALLTGRYQQRMGIEKPLSEKDEGLGDEKAKGEITLARYLQQEGYYTGILGKWHLGSSPGQSPLQYGFDEFKGMLHGSGDYFSKMTTGGNYDWWENDKLVKEEEYNTRLITRHALSFIEANKDKPFFLYVAHNAIHFPWQQPGDTAHRKKDAVYADVNGPLSKLGQHGPEEVREVVRNMIVELDKSVGEIFSKLNELGLDKNTLVIFCSDNGGIEHYQGGYNNISHNKPFRGEKGQVYEGGHRVPAVAWWPGKIAAGTVNEQTVMTMDITPTVLELASIKDVKNKLDGISVTSTLFQQEPIPQRKIFWRHRESYAVRFGNWKLVYHEGAQAPELYDLSKDPSEKSDVAAENNSLASQLFQDLEAWKKQVYQ